MNICKINQALTYTCLHRSVELIACLRSPGMVYNPTSTTTLKELPVDNISKLRVTLTELRFPVAV